MSALSRYGAAALLLLLLCASYVRAGDDDEASALGEPFEAPSTAAGAGTGGADAGAADAGAVGAIDEGAVQSFDTLGGIFASDLGDGEPPSEGGGSVMHSGGRDALGSASDAAGRNAASVSEDGGVSSHQVAVVQSAGGDAFASADDASKNQDLIGGVVASSASSEETSSSSPSSSSSSSSSPADVYYADKAQRSSNGGGRYEEFEGAEFWAADEEPAEEYKPYESSSRSFDDILENYVEDAEYMMTYERDTAGALRFFRIAAVLGHTGAMATVGTLLSSGDVHIPRDMSAGVRFLRMAAAHGQPDAQATLASLYASGIADRHGVEKNNGKALLYWTLAAETGSVVAEAALGYRYLHGVGVQKNCETASRYYQRAAMVVGTDPRHSPTLEKFLTMRPPLPTGLTTEGRVRLSDDAIAQAPAGSRSSDNELLEYYRHSAAHGDVESLTTVAGLQLFGGHGLEANEELARPDLERAAGLGHGAAHGMLAHLALNKDDNVTAWGHFKMAANSRDKVGLYGMGMMYLHGVGVEENATKAVLYFTEASELQHADAAYQVAMAHWRGKGVEKNVNEAYRFFQQASRLGQTQAMMNLGLIVLEGRAPVGKPDCARGVALLKKVVESGEWTNLLELASDEVNDGRIFAGLYRYLQAAHAGIEVAQHNAALLLERSALIAPADASGVRPVPDPIGDTVTAILTDALDEIWEELDATAPPPKHPLHLSADLQHWSRTRMRQEAFVLYEMSFQQGYVQSALRAGHLAAGPMRNYDLASSLYAAGSGARCAECSFSLGMMHALGRGMEVNRTEAVRYFEIARKDSSEGILPGAAALVVFRVAWLFSDTVSALFGGGKGASGESNSSASAGSAQREVTGTRGWGWDAAAGDVVAVSALTCVLGLVVAARRRRLEAVAADART
jgi:TPR repeat protein